MMPALPPTINGIRTSGDRAQLPEFLNVILNISQILYGTPTEIVLPEIHISRASCVFSQQPHHQDPVLEPAQGLWLQPCGTPSQAKKLQDLASLLDVLWLKKVDLTWGVC